MLPGATFDDSYPRTATLIVTVKDGQGRPVDGVPVAFQVAPDWSVDATVTPPHAITQGGRARAILEAETTGLVHVMASVENITEAIAVTVSPAPEIGATSTD